jgi:hypothetical protein
MTFRWPAPPDHRFTTDTLINKKTTVKFQDTELPATVVNVERDDADLLVTLDFEPNQTPLKEVRTKLSLQYPAPMSLTNWQEVLDEITCQSTYENEEAVYDIVPGSVREVEIYTAATTAGQQANVVVYYTCDIAGVRFYKKDHWNDSK